MNVEETIKTIQPNQRFNSNVMSSFFGALRNIVLYRDLVFQLFKRDFFAVYKKSFIGYAWIAISPLASIISWIFLHSTNIINPGDVGVPYPIYVLIGTMMWGLFMGVFSYVMNTMDIYRFMIMKATFPHEVLFTAQILIRLSQFALSFLITVIVLLFFKVISLVGLLLFPIILLPLVLCSIACGLFVSILSVISYDFKRIVMAAIGLVMFITPVIYSIEAIQNVWIKKMILLNPLTYLICSARDIILFNRVYGLNHFILSSLASLVLLVISWRIFYVSEDKIVERMI